MSRGEQLLESALLTRQERQLGDFRLIREIGRGGMGVVYVARQTSLGRLVAVKLLADQFGNDLTRLERFRREAEVISRLDHPSIVPVYAVGSLERTHYIAMKFLEGSNLDEIIRECRNTSGDERSESSWEDWAETMSDIPAVPDRGRPPVAEDVTERQMSWEPSWIMRALSIVERVALALDHAHQKGVIHRDVKPSNIFIDKKEHPWLLDFGLMRDLASPGLTQTDGFMGTAYYVAPEQISGGRNIDHRVDIYSLGVTLYELVTLRRPFESDRPERLLYAIANEEPIPPRKRNPRLPRDLEVVILKAMAKDPAARYQSAAEFAEDLRRLQSLEPIVARAENTWGRFRRWIRCNPSLATAILVAVLSFVGMVEYSVYRDLLDERRARDALANGDSYYERGAWEDALTQYNLYLALDGELDTIRPRIIEVRHLLMEQTRTQAARGR